MTIPGAFGSRDRIIDISSQIVSFAVHGKGEGWREGVLFFPPLGPTVDALSKVPLYNRRGETRRLGL